MLRAARWGLQRFNGPLNPPPHLPPLQIAVVEHSVNHATGFDQRVGTMPLDHHVGGSEYVEIGNQSSFVGKSTMPPSREP
jgi:hypothetical protein